MIVFALLIAGATVDTDSAGLITELVTAALAKEQKLDVIASADVRRQLELEADKAVMGCSEQASCLAELANAMGARFIVYGKLGTLDEVVILTLNLFDSDKAQAAGRVVAKDRSLSALSDRVEPAVKELIATFSASLAEGSRARVLVLDVEAPHIKPAQPAAAPPSEPLSAFFWAGTGALVGGVAVAIVGAAMFNEAAKNDEIAKRPETDAIQTEEVLRTRNDFATGAGVAWTIGGAAIIAGAGMLVYSFVE